MLRKTFITGLIMAVVCGGYFTTPLPGSGTGCAYAATSQSSTTVKKPTYVPIKKAPVPSSHTHSTAASLASVSVVQVNQSTFESKITNTSRYSVYVGQSAPYTEYYTTASNADAAAKAILNKVSNGYFQTSNSQLYNSMKSYGRFSLVKTYSSHGNTVYCFR